MFDFTNPSSENIVTQVSVTETFSRSCHVLTRVGREDVVDQPLVSRPNCLTTAQFCTTTFMKWKFVLKLENITDFLKSPSISEKSVASYLA